MKDLATVWKLEWLRLTSNRGLLFLVVAWPLLYAFFFGGIFLDRVVNHMPTAIVDLDNSALSHTYLRFLESNRSFRLDKSYSSPEELKNDFLSGKWAVAVIIPKDFQRNIKRGHRVQITAWINATNLIVANLAASELATLTGTVAGGVQLKVLRKGGLSLVRAMNMIQPIPLEMARLYNPGLNYLNYLTPGIWAAILHQVLILLGALCFVPHQQRQEIPALLAQVKSSNSFFWGKWIFYFAVGLISFELFFRVVFPVFNVGLHAPVYQLLIFSSLLTATALSLGCLISLASSRTVGAMKGVLLLASPAFILSGYTFPIKEMPAVYKYITAIFPLTPFISGYRKIYQEGATLHEVTPEMLHLALLLVVYLGLALLFYRKKWRAPS